MKRPWSLRRRLLIWLLAPLIAICSALLVEASIGARRAADRAYDRVLAASALAIAERVVVGEDGLEVDLPYVALEMLASTAQDRVFYRIRGTDDRFVTGYRDLPALPADLRLKPGEPSFYDSLYRGDVVRVAVLAQPILSQKLSGRFIVEVAQTRGERTRLTNELVLSNALRFMVLIAAAGSIVWVAVTRGLAPLNQLRAAIRQRSSDDLRPIETVVPREVRELVKAINQFMERLAASLAAMERFIADASHQLRTPLASLRTQAELALRAKDSDELRDSVARLHLSTRRTSRLAEQLLSHARTVDHGRGVRREAVDLAKLAADVARENVPSALARGVDLGVDRIEPGLQVPGDPILLQEMLRNLVDNALRHGRSGDAGSVSVRVFRNGSDCACLEIEDDGPGIPPPERNRVFERFYRIPGSGEGCGLGLAIVREIVEKHDGRIALDAGAGGRGLCVRIELPVRREPAAAMEG